MAGGTADFSFTGTPNGTISTSGATISASVAPGQYVSTEVLVNGWVLSSVTCDDSDSVGSVANHNATFSVAAGENVTCTFTNTAQSTLIVAKVCAGEDDLLPFTVNISGGFTASPTCTVSKQVSLSPGTYSVTETARAGWNAPANGPLPNGWSAPGQIKCDGSALNSNSVTLAAGETKTCVILNVNAACTPAFPPATINPVGGAALNHPIAEPAAIRRRALPNTPGRSIPIRNR